MPDALTPPSALAMLQASRASGGKQFLELFRHGSLTVEIYKPEEIDRQTPHTRDEVYVVIAGTGWFLSCPRRHRFEPGQVLFAPAGVVHRFEEFSADFSTWVFFYGPEGGEAPRSPDARIQSSHERGRAMAERLEVLKTYKLFIGGAFPRSESGRSLPFADPTGAVVAHISHASRKDLRDAVEAARKAFPGWSGATAYNRGQVLYRMAEMLEGKKSEFVELIAAGARARSSRAKSKSSPPRPSPAKEVAAAIDRLVCFGGWADKYAQVLGCNNPVAGPYYNFTVPEPTGVVGVIAPDEAPLLGVISLIAPALCAGNTVVALASEANAIPGAVLGEVCATSDVPPGVVNILTGRRDELMSHFSSHRDIDALHAAGVPPEHARLLREGTAENVKRVAVQSDVDWFDDRECHSPWWIESFVEMKTIWHPSGA